MHFKDWPRIACKSAATLLLLPSASVLGAPDNCTVVPYDARTHASIARDPASSAFCLSLPQRQKLTVPVIFMSNAAMPSFHVRVVSVVGKTEVPLAAYTVPAAKPGTFTFESALPAVKLYLSHTGVDPGPIPTILTLVPVFGEPHLMVELGPL